MVRTRETARRRHRAPRGGAPPLSPSSVVAAPPTPPTAHLRDQPTRALRVEVMIPDGSAGEPQESSPDPRSTPPPRHPRRSQLLARRRRREAARVLAAVVEELREALRKSTRSTREMEHTANDLVTDASLDTEDDQHISTALAWALVKEAGTLQNRVGGAIAMLGSEFP